MSKSAQRLTKKVKPAPLERGDTVWYLVHRRKGKYDVTIFNNSKQAKRFAKGAKIEVFRNDTLAIGAACKAVKREDGSGYGKYKIVRSYRQDSYTDGGKMKTVRIYDRSGKEIKKYKEG